MANHLHSLDVFVVQAILHVYVERSGYASVDRLPEEDIHQP